MPPTRPRQQGLHVYVSEGCVSAIRSKYAPSKMDAVWGRPSAPGDYAYVRPDGVWQPYAPAVLGSERTGPDLSNVGARQASEVWQYLTSTTLARSSRAPSCQLSRGCSRSRARPPKANRSCRCRRPYAPRSGVVVPNARGRRWWRTCSPGVRFRSRAMEAHAELMFRLFIVADKRSRLPSRLMSSRSRPSHHAMAARIGPIDLLLVAWCSRRHRDDDLLRCAFIRPGETSADHIKRRILDEGHEESPMTDESPDDLGDTARETVSTSFLDGAARPLLSTTPPLSFELDTSHRRTGPTSCGSTPMTAGVKGTRTVDFTVRNGPGIAISGHPATRRP